MTDLQGNIISLRDKGYTCRKIAEELGCNYDYVKKLCRKYRKGIVIGRQKKEKPVIDKRINKKCVYCNQPFTTVKTQKIYCSENCRRIAILERARNETKERTKKKYCKTCGTEFWTSNDRKMFCSTRCGKKFRGKGRKYTSYRDTRLKEAVEYNKAINLHTLIKRDNNTCKICGRVCDLYDYEVTATGAMLIGETYPTVDHIYPCSKGGSHTWGNVQLSCMRCNREKSDHIEK